MLDQIIIVSPYENDKSKNIKTKNSDRHHSGDESTCSDISEDEIHTKPDIIIEKELWASEALLKLYDEAKPKKREREIEIGNENQTFISVSRNNKDTLILSVPKGSKIQKQRSKFSPVAIEILRKWLFEHWTHPYPNEEEKSILCSSTHLNSTQITNWFNNARRRIVRKSNATQLIPLLII